jgi:FkbM family methyltransferase
VSQTLFTFVPGQSPIELFEYYEEFKSYYPFCELQTKRWFVQNVEPSWCILDVGANIGYYSILFSRLAPAGRVIAFEPTRTIEKLKTNLARHGVGNVEVEPIAIGNQIGRLEDAIFRVWGQEAERNFYDFETIDHYRERRQIRIDCIKIDTGSFDFEVLMGAERTLLDCNPWIVVELNHALSRRNQSVAQALEWLNARGYLEALVLDYDNYLLKRRSPETGCATGLRLFFDQHRIDREHDLTLADAIDNAIDLSPIFHNHARLDDSLAVPGILSAVAFGPQWSYAVSLKLTQLARESGPGAVRAMLIVTRGTIGVGCLTPGGRNYVGEEVNLTAASEPQEAVIVLRNLSDAHSVVFRNTHPGDMESHFVLVSLDVFRMRVNTPREKPSYMLRGATRISLQELRAQVEAASNSQ